MVTLPAAVMERVRGHANTIGFTVSQFLAERDQLDSNPVYLSYRLGSDGNVYLYQFKGAEASEDNRALEIIELGLEQPVCLQVKFSHDMDLD